jgi:hypothetical protein
MTRMKKTFRRVPGSGGGNRTVGRTEYLFHEL